MYVTSLFIFWHSFKYEFLLFSGAKAVLTDSKEKKVEEVFGFNLQIYILLEKCDKVCRGR